MSSRWAVGCELPFVRFLGLNQVCARFRLQFKSKDKLTTQGERGRTLWTAMYNLSPFTVALALGPSTAGLVTIYD